MNYQENELIFENYQISRIVEEIVNEVSGWELSRSPERIKAPLLVIKNEYYPSYSDHHEIGQAWREYYRRALRGH